jgi:transcriptional regulator with XRE-family HTH domain
MRALVDRRHYSQRALGEMIGVGQQTAGLLLNNEAAGFSYFSATRLARLCGYAGVDTFFRARGVELPRSSAPPPRAA